MSKSEKISVKKAWKKSDGWRGYYEPIFWVCGANDTGNWDDSPCPTNVSVEELSKVKLCLKIHKIKFRETYCQTSNIFCMRRYIVVSENDHDRAREIITDYYNSGLKENTRLLYINEWVGAKEQVA